MQFKSPPLIFAFFMLFAIFGHTQNKTADGISYTVIRQGAGAQPQFGQEVKCHYVVSDANGATLWSTRDVNAPDYIVLGEKQSTMARLRDNCFLLMQPGSRYRFEFPKAMMDDPQAANLPGSYITYDIEVISFGPPQPSGVKLFYQTRRQQGLTVALGQLQQIYESPNGYALREADMNRLGYDLLSGGEIDAAIQVFDMNVRLYPQSFNAFDSLGDAYTQKGDKVQARNAFEKALLINPDFEAAREKLRNL